MTEPPGHPLLGRPCLEQELIVSGKHKLCVSKSSSAIQESLALMGENRAG